VREGEGLMLRIITVDPARHHLGLSPRQVDYQEDVGCGGPITTRIAGAGDFLAT